MAKLDLKRQVAKVQAVQSLSTADASDQVRGRIYEAREYLKRRAAR